MEEKKAINLTELGKLCCWLADNKFRFTFRPLFAGAQIGVFSKDGSYAWDAICHEYSYGGEEGLLEIAGCLVDEEECGDTVRGWLTAEEVIEKVNELLLEGTYPL